MNFDFSDDQKQLRDQARKFLTEKCPPKAVRVVLDGVVLSAPVIREPILHGSGQISGNFTVDQAIDLALMLRSGALAFGMTVVDARAVAPAQN